jgi:hypothetical protein
MWVIVVNPTPSRQIRSVSLAGELLVSELLVVAMPETHRFAGEKAILLPDLADDLFVMRSRERGSESVPAGSIR